jgi:flagellar hook-length control protein FliK
MDFLMNMLHQRDRMDRASMNQRAPGFGLNKAGDAFKSVYHKVARTNTRAMDRSNEAESRQDETERASKADKASKVIRHTLVDMSKKLNMDVDSSLGDLSLTSASAASAEQLAEILYSLKKIAGLLDDAVSKNQGLDTGSAMLSAKEAKAMSTFIHSSIFRIELGVSMLGAADPVSSALAAKLEQPGAGNIPQALDPSQMSMPAAHQAKMSGALSQEFDGGSLLVQKIRELCASITQKDPTVQITSLVSKSSETASSPIASMDSQTMRRILKIDGENADAAGQNQKLGLPLGLDKSVAKNLTVEALRPLEQIMGAGEAAGRPQNQMLLLSSEKLSRPASSFDESVMNQIAGKMHAAVRNGIAEVRLALRPGTLGEVKMKIRVDKGVVSAQIQVENQQVKQTVENNLQSLKDSLLAQNLQTGSLEVSVSTEGWRRHEGGAAQDASATGRDGRDEARGAEGETEAQTIAIGLETGRRFGDNSMEYFA